MRMNFHWAISLYYVLSLTTIYCGHGKMLSTERLKKKKKLKNTKYYLKINTMNALSLFQFIFLM